MVDKNFFARVKGRERGLPTLMVRNGKSLDATRYKCSARIRSGGRSFKAGVTVREYRAVGGPGRALHTLRRD